MNSGPSLAALSFVLPIGSETRWSDMLAFLIGTDPQPFFDLVDWSVAPGDLVVRREVVVGSERFDVTLGSSDGDLLAVVVEVKVLAGLGPSQLARYVKAKPDAERHIAVFPGRLPIDLGGSTTWRALTWEVVLGAYRASSNGWLANLAAAWVDHLDASVPAVDEKTVWNEIAPGETFQIALRARMSWVFGAIRPPAGVEHDLVTSSAGGSAVVRMSAATPLDGYRVMAEIEEKLSVRQYPKPGDPAVTPLGPSAKVVLIQSDVDTSAGFNWDYLHAMWPVMEASKKSWVTTRARPKALHDRENLRKIVEQGAPAFLGIGFGDAQTKYTRACMFGARIQYPADATLGDIADTMNELADLLVEMAAVSHRRRSMQNPGRRLTASHR